jgi:hypothetical protein
LIFDKKDSKLSKNVILEKDIPRTEVRLIINFLLAGPHIESGKKPMSERILSGKRMSKTTVKPLEI